MNYVQLNISATEIQQEILIGLLSQYAVIGFEQLSESLLVYFDEAHLPITEIRKELESYTYEWNVLKEENWNALWESNFDPVTINNFCGIRAHFHQPLLDVEHEIIITPKMSFGTGHHDTTYLMVEQMSALDFTKKRVLDFGTGTGVLSILAEKLGAASVLAIDNDEWSIENARENFDRNDCQKINLQLTSTIPEGTYDVILANINKNVLLQNAVALYHESSIPSTLLLSGLMPEDEKEIKIAFEQSGFHFESQKATPHWISLLFLKS